jgi:hypothetical protein
LFKLSTLLFGSRGTKGVILKGIYCTKLNGFGIHVRHHLLGTPLGIGSRGTKGVILKGIYCTKLNGFGIHVRHHLLGTPLGR